MKRSDVEMRHEHGRSYPAVNIKVYGNWRSVPLPLELGSGDGKTCTTAPEFNRDWVERQHPDTLEACWQSACESAVESLSGEASECLGRPVEVEQVGRSGGWLQVRGLPPLAGWDAVALARWAKWAGWCNAARSAIPADFLLNVYHNLFLTEAAEVERKETPV